jgi:hypothetical protein
MNRIDAEIRFVDAAERWMRRESYWYRIWSFTDAAETTRLYLGRVNASGEPVRRYDWSRAVLVFDAGKVQAQWRARRFETPESLADAWIGNIQTERSTD